MQKWKTSSAIFRKDHCWKLLYYKGKSQKTSTMRNYNIFFSLWKTIIFLFYFIWQSTQKPSKIQKYYTNYTINRRLFAIIFVLCFRKKSAFFQLYFISHSFALSLLPTKKSISVSHYKHIYTVLVVHQEKKNHLHGSTCFPGSYLLPTISIHLASTIFCHLHTVQGCGEYWMVYRGPGILAVVWFGSFPTLSPRR